MRSVVWPKFHTVVWVTENVVASREIAANLSADASHSAIRWVADSMSELAGVLPGSRGAADGAART